MSALENSTTQKGELLEKTAPDGFPWPEKELAERFGCSPASLQDFREHRMEQGVAWVKYKRHIFWSEFAVRSAAEALGLVDAELTWLEREKTPAAVTLYKFAVYPRRTMNPHIIMASGPKGLVRVRVKTKDNFRAGMEVRCVHVAGDLFELVGNCPRFPGKY